MQKLLCFDSQEWKNTRYLGQTQSPITSMWRVMHESSMIWSEYMFQADNPPIISMKKCPKYIITKNCFWGLIFKIILMSLKIFSFVIGFYLLHLLCYFAKKKVTSGNLFGQNMQRWLSQLTTANLLWTANFLLVCN